MASEIPSGSECPDEATSRPGVPRPGDIYDPVARTLDAIGDRWSLVLVRHLLLGPRGFQDLRQRTGIAPRVLSTRLRGLRANGFVEALESGGYQLTDRGLSLEPIVSSIARWFTRHGLDALQLDISQFTETSAQSVLESLPFLLRERDTHTEDVTFEIRLTGAGGGVWSVRIEGGQCHVEQGFAEHADVRYTADAKVWCAMALGLADARDLVKRGLVTKDGGPAAMDHYFHQISHPEPTSATDEGKTTIERNDDR